MNSSNVPQPPSMIPASILFQQKKDKFYEDSLNTLQLERNKNQVKYIKNIEILRKIFFHPSNIDFLQKSLIRKIYHSSGGKYLISRQSDDSLLPYMEDIWSRFQNLITDNVPTTTEEIRETVRDLDTRVLNVITCTTIPELEMYDSYLQRAFGKIEPIGRPVNVSNTGKKPIPSITRRLE